MPTLDMSVPHQLSEQDAMTRIKGLLSRMKVEHGDRMDNLREEWDGTTGRFSFSTMGFAISGTLSVTPANVRIVGDLPMAASFFKSTIESAIRERATELLA